jgi:hypothetical protein
LFTTLPWGLTGFSIMRDIATGRVGWATAFDAATMFLPGSWSWADEAVDAGRVGRNATRTANNFPLGRVEDLPPNSQELWNWMNRPGPYALFPDSTDRNDLISNPGNVRRALEALGTNPRQEDIIAILGSITGPTEMGVVLDANGNVIAIMQGTFNEQTWKFSISLDRGFALSGYTQNEAGQLIDSSGQVVTVATFIHSHPSGISLSIEDLNIATRLDIENMVAIGIPMTTAVPPISYTYAFRRPEGGWLPWATYEGAMKRAQQVTDAQLRASYDASGIDMSFEDYRELQGASGEYNHMFWMNMGNEVPFSYTRTTNEKQ